MKILLLEDNPTHRREAEKIILAYGHELVYSLGVLHTGWSPDLKKVEGAILDVHVGFSTWDPITRTEGVRGADSPGGVHLALECLDEGIPVVFCTDANHHGNKVEWLHRSIPTLRRLIGEKAKVCLIDSSPTEEERCETLATWTGQKKPWEDALFALVSLSKGQDP